jgi:hypothetical protein
VNTNHVTKRAGTALLLGGLALIALAPPVVTLRGLAQSTISRLAEGIVHQDPGNGPGSGGGQAPPPEPSRPGPPNEGGGGSGGSGPEAPPFGGAKGGGQTHM